LARMLEPRLSARYRSVEEVQKALAELDAQGALLPETRAKLAKFAHAANTLNLFHIDIHEQTLRVDIFPRSRLYFSKMIGISGFLAAICFLFIISLLKSWGVILGATAAATISCIYLSHRYLRGKNYNTGIA